jgi:hypothetical protein
LGCPASFQKLKEGVLRNILNVLVYIYDLLVHTDSQKNICKSWIKFCQDYTKIISK